MHATSVSAHLCVQARDAIVPITMNASPVKAGEHVSLIGELFRTLLDDLDLLIFAGPITPCSWMCLSQD